MPGVVSLVAVACGGGERPPRFRNASQSGTVATMMAWHQVNHPSVVLWALPNESEVDSVTYRDPAFP